MNPTQRARLEAMQEAAERAIAAHPDDLWASFQEYAAEVTEALEPPRVTR